MEHQTTIHKYDNGVKVTCTCGWMDMWKVNDGSAEESGYWHKKRANNGQA